MNTSNFITKYQGSCSISDWKSKTVITYEFDCEENLLKKLDLIGVAHLAFLETCLVITEKCNDKYLELAEQVCVNFIENMTNENHYIKRDISIPKSIPNGELKIGYYNVYDKKGNILNVYKFTIESARVVKIPKEFLNDYYSL